MAGPVLFAGGWACAVYYPDVNTYFAPAELFWVAVPVLFTTLMSKRISHLLSCFWWLGLFCLLTYFAPAELFWVARPVLFANVFCTW